MKKTLTFWPAVILIVIWGMQMSFAGGPKREFRGAWIASVDNLDWPSNPNLSVSEEKNDLINMLDELKDTGINIVMFQIRPECDALYDSPYEPWSYWLTGQQGRAPEPFYDPLEFAVLEAHKRGLEIHAWFNPYRAERSVGSYSIDAGHVINANPDWILDFGSLKILDPGLPMVRQHVTNVIMDVVNRYDVDGVHFDDYFYPYPPDHISQTNKDKSTYDNYKHGDESDNNIEDWRRENVNILMRMISDSIQTVKPHVKFGISPFGIYKNGVPSGIIGMDAYNVIYADPLAWLAEHSVDYLTPQLYWEIGGGQDYEKLVNWWADQVDSYDRQIYPGQILNTSFSTDELPNQLKLNRNKDKVLGQVFFRAARINNNTLGFQDKLRNNYYENRALIPQMPWKDSVQPNTPQNIDFGPLAYGQPAVIYWQIPELASDGDSAKFYVIYRFAELPQSEADFDDPSKILDITGPDYLLPPSINQTTDPYYFVVKALDENYNESTMSDVLTIEPPSLPSLAYPVNQEKHVYDVDTLSWGFDTQSSYYQIQLAVNDDFENLIMDEPLLTDTFKVIMNLNGLTDYYWRVKAKNPAGESAFTDANVFTTAFPPDPQLVSPENRTKNVALDTTLSWDKADSAEAYRVQLAHSQFFQENYIELDTIITADTSLMVNNLEPFDRLWYYWRVKAINDYGESDWSKVWEFRTVEATAILAKQEVPDRYYLGKNYPNPFNPFTTIEFALPERGHVRMQIYNMMGQKVATVVDEVKGPGQYTVQVDGTNLSSGVYIYRLSVNQQNLTGKMILMK
ncbi:MAG: family 10 glycosylhydrolase [Caldithrix sp.]|nr:family 10 glycosylhydrolase [Caldithrix sp.]